MGSSSKLLVAMAFGVLLLASDMAYCQDGTLSARSCSLVLEVLDSKPSDELVVTALTLLS